MWTSLLALFSACAPISATGDSGRATPDDTDALTQKGCLDYAPAIEIGTGYSAWWPMKAYDPLIMVHGPQGGWHLLCSARVHHTDPVVSISFTVNTEAGDVVADNFYEVALFPGSNECNGVFSGMYAFLDVSDLAQGELNTPPELLAGELLTVEMSIVDAAGRAASDTLIVTATLDPADL